MMQRFSIWTWAFVTCAAAVLVLALMPAPPPVITTGWDKSNHLLAFGVMTWLGCKAFPQRCMPLLLGLLAYGALIEILQSYVAVAANGGRDERVHGGQFRLRHREVFIASYEFKHVYVPQ